MEVIKLCRSIVIAHHKGAVNLFPDKGYNYRMSEWWIRQNPNDVSAYILVDPVKSVTEVFRVSDTRVAVVKQTIGGNGMYMINEFAERDSKMLWEALLKEYQPLQADEKRVATLFPGKIDIERALSESSKRITKEYNGVESLTKENFWDAMDEKYPLAMKRFCEWIDRYKKEVEWDYLFFNKQQDELRGEPIKYHHLPIAMQLGIFIDFVKWEEYLFVDVKWSNLINYEYRNFIINYLKESEKILLKQNGAF